MVSRPVILKVWSRTPGGSRDLWTQQDGVVSLPSFRHGDYCTVARVYMCIQLVPFTLIYKLNKIIFMGAPLPTVYSTPAFSEVKNVIQ